MAKSDNGELNNSNLASNNSDPNNSLLQKVTKRVSGLFPSSISKWFGPSDGSTSSVIRRRETEDDDEQLQIQQPPKKRAKSAATVTTEMEFSTSSNHIQMTSTPLLNSRHLQPGPSGYSRHTMLFDAGDGPSTSRHQPLLNGDDKSDKTDKSDSGESTSGYSSVLVQQNKEPSFVSDREHGIHQPSTSKDTGTPSPNKSQNTSLNSSRSLFSEQSLTSNPQRQCLSARRPSFNSSTFGSPTFVDRTLSTKRAVNSPFYGGRTIYGGASAYKRNRIIFPRDEANNLQVKNSVNIKPVNDSTPSQENVSLSKTARRILDTLEHFSTPVLDAKKIPNINRQTINKQQRLAPYARETTPKTSAPTRELIIPTVPDLLKMKQKERLQNSTEQVRKLATTSKSVLNSEYSIRTLDDDECTKPQKHTSKIKAKIATVREKKDQLRDTIDAVKLPEIKLPITSLPKFDFTLPTPPPVVSSTPTTTTVLQKPEMKAAAIQVNSDRFKFAKPIIVNCDKPPLKSINHFKFSEPIDAKKPENSATNLKENTLVSLTFKAEGSTAPRKKDQKINGQNDVGFSLKPPEQLVQGSVMDILGKPDSLMDKFKPVVGTWECLSCMVRNIPTATRCVACETLKEPVKKAETKPANSFGNQFKMTAEKWECSACMVRNNNSETKCVACTTPRVNSAAPATKTTAGPAIFGGFGDKFKPASDTWECGACMIRNKSDAVKCVACETPKPGAVKEAKSSLIMRIPEAPAASSSGFTDLIKKQQTNWECPSCMVRNPPEKKTCACCEGPKPGEKQEFKFGTGTTQFKFGIDKAAAPTANTSGSGFSFGGNSTPATTFSFGVKPPANTVDSKPTGFTFGVPTTAAATPKTESQATPIITTAVVNTAATPKENTADVAKTSSTPSFSFGLPIQTSSTSVVLNGDPKKMFSFGTQSTTITSSTNSTTKPTNIFNPVTSLTSATTPKPAAISTPSVSNSTVSSTSITTATTTTGAAAASSSTTFSFGTTPKATFEETKKPSAPIPQFNFGSGSLPFNPVFGSNNTTKATTTAFVQPTTNFLNSTPQKTESTQHQTGFIAPTFTFKSSSSTSAATNNNKTEVKPFSFASTTPKPETPKGGGKFPEFSFNPLTANTTATTAGPLTKAPVMNFAANSSSTTDAAQKAPNSLFSFGTKTETKAPSFGGGSMFGQSVQQVTQNGGFNFGATAVTPNFNFGGAGGGIGAGVGAATASSTTPTVFGFGTSQAGSGSATAASAPGLFTFGGGAPAQQPTTAAFTPDIKPNFNFSGGTAIGSFTAQGGPSATMPQRKIRKAVRRTQPR